MKVSSVRGADHAGCVADACVGIVGAVESTGSDAEVKIRPVKSPVGPEGESLGAPTGVLLVTGARRCPQLLALVFHRRVGEFATRPPVFSVR